MYTEIININDEVGIRRAADLLKQGRTVALPTETVYGLAANALDGEAVKKIFRAKGRPQDNPLIVHVAEFEELYPLVSEVPKVAKKLAGAFWPGPLTMIFKKSGAVPYEVSAGLDTIAIRMPSHPVIVRIIKAAGLPLAAPSANLSGSPSPTSARHVIHDLFGKIDGIVDGGDCQVGLESTVLDITRQVPCILRPGGITKEQIEQVIGEVCVASSVLEKTGDGQKALSPGMKYKHYSPKAKVVLVRGSSEDYVSLVNGYKAEGLFALCFDEDVKKLTVPYLSYGSCKDYKTQAKLLFSALREADGRGASVLLAHSPEPVGIGLAVYNRLLRAAEFEELLL